MTKSFEDEVVIPQHPYRENTTSGYCNREAQGIEPTRNGKRGGETVTVIKCSYCDNLYEVSPRIIRWRLKHKPHWKNYCSTFCRDRGMRDRCC